VAAINQYFSSSVNVIHGNTETLGTHQSVSLAKKNSMGYLTQEEHFKMQHTRLFNPEWCAGAKHGKFFGKMCQQKHYHGAHNI
jgi:hypothetical protein